MAELRVRLAVIEGRDHSLYEELLAAPPEGVSYVTSGNSSTGPAPLRSRLVWRMRRNGAVRSVADPFFARALPDAKSGRPGFSFRVVKGLRGAAIGSKGREKEALPFDILHSAGSSMLENIPWIVEKDLRWVSDFEFVASLFGYYGNWRKRIYRPRNQRITIKQLSSRYCRRLMPWTEAAKSTVENVLKNKDINEKMEVLRLAMRPAPPRPNNLEKHDRVRILFIGSSNFRGEFWSKGGFEVLESYRLLRERLGDSVELMFRCWMPDELRNKYASMPGLYAICEVLPREEFNRLFWESDIFLWPGHLTPGLAFLEAMRFGLPVVGKDIWANKETVEDGTTGFLVKPSERIPYYLPGFVPNASMDGGPFLPYMKMRDDRVIADLVDRLVTLSKSETLRKGMGEAGRRAVEGGKFSIARRNIQLKRIYEEAARR
jgi:glycosyltransferase involved in cell wall biosynthesis